MNVDALLQIVQTRINSNDGNPTSKSFLYEIYAALEELKNLKENGGQNDARN